MEVTETGVGGGAKEADEGCGARRPDHRADKGEDKKQHRWAGCVNHLLCFLRGGFFSFSVD